MSAPETRRPNHRRTLRFLAVAVVLSLSLGAGMTALTAGRTAAIVHWPAISTLTFEEQASLENMYSPVLTFSSGERTFPVNVEYYIANSRLVGGTLGGSIEHPAPDDLGGQWRTGCYLDNSDGTRSDGGAIRSYELDRGMLDDTIYVRTVEKAGAIVIQYWLFYVFNLGTYNSHEGDWEMVQVILDNDTLAPRSLTLSQHHDGARISWGRLAEGDLMGTHPTVLVAAGSHANYLPSGSARAPGDRADGTGEVLGPSDYRLMPIGQEENGRITPSWLFFQGPWGETAAWGGILGTDGPQGPMFREGGLMWDGLGWGA